MDVEIIDFHTHPFLSPDENICSHAASCAMGPRETEEYLRGLGISRICGSVIGRAVSCWADLVHLNDDALRLRDLYGDFYLPGFHVHPDYVEESIREMDRMQGQGVRLIGELVPYAHGWDDYSCPGFSEILDEAARRGLVVNFHGMGEDAMDRMVQAHPDAVLVCAHPGEYDSVIRHFQRMRMSRNYYLDLSGAGLFRHGMLRHGIDEHGAERFLFGSDFPTCGPANYIGGVGLDTLVTDAERRLIFAGNAKRLLSC
ncbi:MAG: amidohydrolase family protein [Kiritimatiellia bacterium]|jgi:predicted TIM-barrel fold metal-dependent hydrolase